MALSLAGERSFKAMNAQRWKAFSNRAQLPEAAALRAVTEIAGEVDRFWWSLPERVYVSHKVLERIDGQIKAMMPMLGTCAE